jgi:hypothetical protein
MNEGLNKTYFSYLMDSLSEVYFLKCELGINYCLGLGK